MAFQSDAQEAGFYAKFPEKKPTNGEDKSKLPGLPPDNDPFWDHSEKIPIIQEAVNKDCRHYFILMKAREAQCKSCGWGIYLGPEDRIEVGSLYSFDKKIL